jgi:transposase
MLDEARASGEHSNLMFAVRHVMGLLGVSAETLRVWHRRREVAELRKANEILKAASVFFAKELDRS